jgi:hypothetical protein
MDLKYAPIAHIHVGTCRIAARNEIWSNRLRARVTKRYIRCAGTGPTLTDDVGRATVSKDCGVFATDKAFTSQPRDST